MRMPNPLLVHFVSTSIHTRNARSPLQESSACIRRRPTTINHRVHWAFRHDEVKAPIGKLRSIKGRPLPDNFELKLLATGKRFTRTVDGQGRISWKRYRLYVRVELKKERVEIQEFFDSLVITYQSGAVASYACSHEHSQIASISNAPIFHDHPGIETSAQLELFDFSRFRLCYVSHRPPNRKRPRGNAKQLMIEGLG